ncbi:endoribonuclease ysh1 [Tulasnella sp. UAMH 9824]|nr:endoribonuclease ysh1 [Tulasnella sp. UAMH 9824]
MFMIDIAGLKILYTGDYSREEDRHLVKAEVPPVRPDVLIVESTFGVQSLEGRHEKEARFTSEVHAIIRRGGHVLLPVFALGGAQELLLILDEYWDQHPELHDVPVYYASSLAKKCMTVYQTYIHTMNANIRTRFEKRDNPFVFKHISSLPHTRNWEKKVADGPPCVVLATPGFLHTGSSRELLELWAPDPRNGLIITGYSVEGTMARDIMNEPDEITGLRGNAIPRRLSVLVHGEQTAMGRLRGALQSKYKNRDEDVKVHTPRNLETLHLTLQGDRVARAIGSLANNPPPANAESLISGLLVSKDYSYTLLDPKDLREFTGLSTSDVLQMVRIAIGCGWELVRWHLEGMYGFVQEGLGNENGARVMRVMGAVHVKHISETELMLEWIASASNDMIADSVIAVLMGIDSSPASVKLTNSPHGHHHVEATSEDVRPSDKRQTPHPHANKGQGHSYSPEEAAVLRLERIVHFLEAHFGDVQMYEAKPAPNPEVNSEGNTDMIREDLAETPGPEEPAIIVKLDDKEARINLMRLTVHGDPEPLRRRVESVLHMAIATTGSLAEQLTSADLNSTSDYEDARVAAVQGGLVQVEVTTSA